MRRFRVSSDNAAVVLDVGQEDFEREVIERSRNRPRELETGDPGQAEALYRRALELDRRHEPACLGLARLLVTRGKEDEAEELLTEVGTTGAAGAEAEALRGRIFLQRLARPFGK